MHLGRRLAAGWVVCTLAVSGAAAQDVGVFQLFVNLQPRGDVFVRHEGAGDYWIKVADLRAGGLTTIEGETKTMGGEPHVRIGTLRGVVLDVDDRELTLSITAKPELLGRQAFDLGDARPLAITPSIGTSAYLNYRVGYQASEGAAPARTLENQLNVRAGAWLFRYEDSYASDLPDHRYVRQSTNLVRDWPDSMQRLNIGDVTALSGELGTSRTLGGLTFSRVFGTQPSFVSNPTARFVGTVSLPSTAEIYVDGVRVRTLRLNPGVYQLNNLDYYGGLRNTQIVLRDAYGGRQVLAQSFYFSDELLKKGLHDYSYSGGVEREDVGVRSNRYSGAAYSLYHRYGLTDAITVGVSSDGNRESYAGGPGIGVSLGGYGVIGGALAVRRNKILDTTGYARIARYMFESPHWSVRAQIRDADLAYGITVQNLIVPATENATTRAASVPNALLFASALAVPHRDVLAGVGYSSEALGSLSFDVTRSSRHDGTFRNAKTFGYSRAVKGSINLFISVSRVREESQSGWEGLAGVSMSFDNDRHASVTRQKVLGFGSIDRAEFSKSAPEGEGHGYRLSLENSPDGRLFEPFAQVNTRHFVVTADASHRAGGPDSASASVAGAVVITGGRAALTRPVASSFAVVQVGDVEGVRVYRNQQEIGRTDARGTVVLPNITSYAYNVLSFAADDLPLHYEISEVEKTVVPGLGGGVLAAFGVRAIRAYEGVLQVKDDRGTRAVEHATIAFSKGGKAAAFITGYRGEFYLDGVEAGEYAASFGLEGRKCSFVLRLPATTQALTRLPATIAACESPSPR